MNKRKKYIKSCEVSELCEFTLGGYRQKVLIEGLKKDVPVLVCLHGGPGSPVPFGEGCRGLFPEWTSKAIMVFWDQLGCGINNRKIDDGFKIENFVDMTCDLVRAIKDKFPQNKLYLFGVSWGSILTLQTALRVHGLLNGAFVYGQFLKNNFFSGEVLSAFSAAPAIIRLQIEKIVETGGDCGYAALDKNLKTLYKSLSEYTDAYINKNSKPIKVSAIVKGLLLSPDYSFKDFKAVVKNGYKGNQSLWRELLNIDLAKSLEGVKIPYLIFQGDTDIVTSTNYVKQAVECSGNKNLNIKIIKDSGHVPSASGMEEVFCAITDFIK